MSYWILLFKKKTEPGFFFFVQTNNNKKLLVTIQEQAKYVQLAHINWLGGQEEDFE